MNNKFYTEVKMSGPWGLFITFLVHLFAVCVRSEELSSLRLAQIVFRHGDRSPLQTFPTDPNQEDAWEQGFGQLTQLGIKEEYNIGKKLRELYNGFLNGTYIHNEIRVESTDYDRTLMSAESVLAAMYPPVPAQQWNPNLSWLPIPIHTQPLATDKVLYTDLPCDRYTDLKDQAYQSEQVLQYKKDNAEFLRTLTEKSGVGAAVAEPTLEDLMLTIPEPLLCEKIHNMTWADWVTESIYEDTQYLSLVKARLWFPIPEMIKLRGGRWMYEAVKRIKNHVNRNPDQQEKMFLYSAHDSSIVAFLSAMGVWDDLIPPYSAFFMLELHEANKGDYTVKIFYKNDTNINYEADPVQLYFPGCQDPCSLDDFMQLVEPMLVSSNEELDELCKAKASKVGVQGKTIALIIIAMIVILGLVSFCIVCQRRRKNEIPYQSANFATDVPHA